MSAPRRITVAVRIAPVVCAAVLVYPVSDDSCRLGPWQFARIHRKMLLCHSQPSGRVVHAFGVDGPRRSLVVGYDVRLKYFFGIGRVFLGFARYSPLPSRLAVGPKCRSSDL